MELVGSLYLEFVNKKRNWLKEKLYVILFKELKETKNSILNPNQNPFYTSYFSFLLLSLSGLS